MTRDVAETISIGVEVISFFFAAPEFLGETALAS